MAYCYEDAYLQQSICLDDGGNTESVTPKKVSASRSSYSAGVAKAQTALTAAGYNPGPVDGIWGPKTAAAVLAFQKSSGLKSSGQLDAATTAALYGGVSEPVPEAKPATVTVAGINRNWLIIGAIGMIGLGIYYTNKKG